MASQQLVAGTVAAHLVPAWQNARSESPAPVQPHAPVAAASTFTDLEWSIIAMAERDGLASLRRPNAFWSLIGAVFGIKPANRLANDRLEALRRLAVLAWRYRWNVPRTELQDFFAAGFSPAQFELMLGRISAVRAEQRGRHAR